MFGWFLSTAWVSLVMPGLVAVSASLDLSNMPRSICGWPSLHEGGKFPEWNTRLAQYLLGYALGEDIPADGIFTTNTTNQISR